MTEFNPDAHLNLTFPSGESVKMTRYNSAFFSFIGNLSMYNHVFVSFEEDMEEALEEGDAVPGSYIFSENSSFLPIVDYMAEQDFPAHINMTSVPDCDRDAYERMALAEPIPEYLPDEWFNDGET